MALARFAIFPTGLLAATAGPSGVPAERFFPADAAALVVSSGHVVGAGHGLGIAERASQDWLLGIGLAGLLTLSDSSRGACRARGRAADATPPVATYCSSSESVISSEV